MCEIGLTNVHGGVFFVADVPKMTDPCPISQKDEVVVVEAKKDGKGGDRS